MKTNKKINWLIKLLIILLPKRFLQWEAWRRGVAPERLRYAEHLFAGCKRIDIQPLCGQTRGFILFLDSRFSIWFFQDGDHFTFDGYEVGEYGAGEVTVFDRLAK